MPPSIHDRWNPLFFMVSFIGTMLYVVSSTPVSVMNTFVVVLGQGHFALAYLYQYRAGKITRGYMLRYAIAAIFLGLAFILVPEPLKWSLLVAGAFFAVHFFVDEYYMSRAQPQWDSYLLCAAFLILYASILLRHTYAIEQPLLATIAALVCAIPALVRIVRTRAVEPPLIFGVAGCLILGAFVWLPAQVDAQKIVGFVILMHYVRWYLFAGVSNYAHPDAARFKKYLYDVAAVNAIVGAAYICFVTFPSSPLRFIFNPEFFYAWTVLHIVASMRLPQSGYANYFR